MNGDEILILWASRTGNTANLAQRISEVLLEEGFQVNLLPVANFDWALLRNFKAVLFGSPTYGSGDLHQDWDKPERLLRDFDLNGVSGAAFGCGSSRYPTPCWAVDILENRLKNCGAKVLIPGLRMDTLSSFRVRDADAWVYNLIEKIS